MLTVTLRCSLAATALASTILLAAGCGSEGSEQGTTEPAPATTTEAPTAPPATESPAPPATTTEAPPTSRPAEPAAPTAAAAPAAPPAPEPEAPQAAAEQDPPRGYEPPEPGPPPTTTSTTEAPSPTTTTSTTEAPPPTTTSTTEAPPPTTTTSTTEAPPPTTTTEPAADVTIRITLVDGRIEAERRYEVSLGDTVEVRVASDVAEEVHLHGYDLYLQLEPGAEVTLTFEARLPGVWEAELHPSHRELFQLQVS